MYRTDNNDNPGKVLGVVGWSGSGKTTLVEFLIGGLAARGVRVNALKHSHHDVTLEPAGKDSARFRNAGAAEVILASPYRYALVRELHGAPEPTLRELLSRLSPADITIVEGFKWEPMPKVEVWRPSLGNPALHPDDPDIVAVASDVPAPAGLRGGLDWLNLNDPAQVLGWIEKVFLGRA